MYVLNFIMLYSCSEEVRQRNSERQQLERNIEELESKKSSLERRIKLLEADLSSREDELAGLKVRIASDVISLSLTAVDM